MGQEWGKDKVGMGCRKGQKWGEADGNGARGERNGMRRGVEME